ncbi:ABC transporter permease [Roseovarius sp. 2305UL8-3]|uniref:ABC transporter permease n=1 Tax=Roseovarius conchicola TaxID=3121636 RepID=UPI003527DD2E
MLSSPFRPSSTIRIFSSAEYCLRVARRMSLTTFSPWLLRVPGWGSRSQDQKPFFLLGTALFLFTATALGVFLATIARSMAQFALLVMLIILPMLMLSGGETPVEGQPDWLQIGTLILPSRHYMAASQAIVFKGAGLETVWPEFMWMALLGATLLTISLVRFRQSVVHDG